MNRCLSSLPNTVVLSEVHPDGGGGPADSPKTVKEQAKRVVSNGRLIVSSLALGVEELLGICKANSKRSCRPRVLCKKLQGKRRATGMPWSY